MVDRSERRWRRRLLCGGWVRWGFGVVVLVVLVVMVEWSSSGGMGGVFQELLGLARPVGRAMMVLSLYNVVRR